MKAQSLSDLGERHQQNERQEYDERKHRHLDKRIRLMWTGSEKSWLTMKVPNGFTCPAVEFLGEETSTVLELEYTLQSGHVNDDSG